MEKREFAEVMAFLEAGCQKPLNEESARVYFSILGQLPLEALREAAVECLKANTFPVFPQIGTLWQAAQAFMRRGQKAIERWEGAGHAREVFGELADRWKRRAIEADLEEGRDN